MKRSNVAAIGVGVLTTGIGIVAAVLCPVAGLVGGAYFAASAASAASMGTGAVWVLGAAGAVGGFFLGNIAAPVVAMGAVGLGAVAGGLTKAAASSAGFFVRFVKGHKDSVPSPTKIARTLKGVFKPLHLKPGFDAAVNDNASKAEAAPKPAQSLKPAP